MHLPVDGSIDQQRISVSECIIPSPCLPPERRRTGSTGWLSDCVCGMGLCSSEAFEAFDRSKQITVIVVYHLWFDLRLQNDAEADNQTQCTINPFPCDSWKKAVVEQKQRCVQRIYISCFICIVLAETKKKKKRKKLLSSAPGNRIWPCHIKGNPTTESGGVACWQPCQGLKFLFLFPCNTRPPLATSERSPNPWNTHILPFELLSGTFQILSRFQWQIQKKIKRLLWSN